MLYRIFTEDIPENHDAILEQIASQYEGFTVIKGDGFWRLQPEKSLIIEVVTIDEDAKITALANAIKEANAQEAVLVQKIENSQWFV